MVDADDVFVFKPGWWRRGDWENPPRRQVGIFGAWAPDADPRWRRQRLEYAIALGVFGLAVWGVGMLILRVA